MAKHRRKQPKRRAAALRSATGPVVRSPFRRAADPIAWSALVSATVLALAGPAYAAPSDSTGTRVPDTGARPVPAGALQLPGGAAVPANTQLSSLAAQVTAAETEVSRLGEQLKQVSLDRAGARTNLALADRAWREATDRLTAAEQSAGASAAEAYKAAAGMPPGLNADLRGLGALSMAPGDGVPGMAPARDLVNAQQDERAKFQAYSQAIKAEETLATRYLTMQTTYQQRERALLELRQRNASQLAVIEQEREAEEQRLGAQFVGNGSLNGFAASPRAMAAVRVALDQLGDPYLWAAEGPDRFDCSGLMWYSYRYGADHALPRVSRDQYNGTRGKPVSRYALLPGDLLFFASNPNDWTSIHHVGMYIGNGKMVHAPSAGDVVKISTVWWSRFFAATRVFGEVPTPSTGTPPAPSTGQNPPPPSPSPAPSRTTHPPSPKPSAPSTPPTKPPSSPPSTPPPSSAPPSTPPSSPPSTPPSSAPPADPPSSAPPADPPSSSASPAGEPEPSPPASEPEPSPSATATSSQPSGGSSPEPSTGSGGSSPSGASSADPEH